MYVPYWKQLPSMGEGILAYVTVGVKKNFRSLPKRELQSEKKEGK
jgi:hypothetical protein